MGLLRHSVREYGRVLPEVMSKRNEAELNLHFLG